MSEIPDPEELAQMAPKVVTLRTGATVPAPVVDTTIDALSQLTEINPIALFKAVEIARGASRKPTGDTGVTLEEIGLLENGVMHDATRDVILAAIEGRDDLSLTRQDLQAWRISLKTAEGS